MTSKERLKNLIDLLIHATGKKQWQISEGAGYDRNSLTEALARSKGHEPVIEQLELVYKDVINFGKSLLEEPENPMQRHISKRMNLKKDADIPAYNGNTRMGKIEVYSDDPKMQKPVGYLPAELFPGCNHSERVRGDSMYPLIVNQGWIVGKIVDKQGIIWGEKYVIHTVYGENIVKYVHPSTNGKEYLKIKSHNKIIPDQDIPIDDITFCARVHFIINPS